MGLYLVKPEVKPGLVCPVPKDAKPTESQKAYYARKYMEIHSTRSYGKKGQIVISGPYYRFTNGHQLQNPAGQ